MPGRKKLYFLSQELHGLAEQKDKKTNADPLVRLGCFDRKPSTLSDRRSFPRFWKWQIEGQADVLPGETSLRGLQMAIFFCALAWQGESERALGLFLFL